MEDIVALRVSQAFPLEHARDVAVVLSRLRPGPYLPTADDIGTVVVGRDALRIPARVYLPEPEPTALAALTDNQKLIAYCLFTRHHDGYVRERMLKLVIPRNFDWVTPFVVQLLGEYVIEIHQVLLHGLLPDLAPSYARFLQGNPTFWFRTRQRVISYWNCYFRSEFPNRNEYPASRVVTRLENWLASHDVTRRPTPA